MMYAIPLPFRATQKNEYSNLTLYRLEWRYLKRDGTEAQPADQEAGIWRKANSRKLPKGIEAGVSAIGPDGKLNGEPVTREQVYARDTAAEAALLPLVPLPEEGMAKPAKAGDKPPF